MFFKGSFLMPSEICFISSKVHFFHSNLLESYFTMFYTNFTFREHIQHSVYLVFHTCFRPHVVFAHIDVFPINFMLTVFVKAYWLTYTSHLETAQLCTLGSVKSFVVFCRLCLFACIVWEGGQECLRSDVQVVWYIADSPAMLSPDKKHCSYSWKHTFS